MTDNWDFYSCTVDDEAASIFVDLGLAAEAPLPNLQYMAYVHIYMRNPRPDGLSSTLEFDELIRIEDQLTGILTSGGATIYAGRNTSGGCRDFYFYVTDPGDWDTRVSDAMSTFADYKYEVGSRLDGEWRTYFEFLYPADEDMERIQNRRVCEVLQKSGDELTAPREIVHWAYFPDASSRARFIAKIVEFGFALRELTEGEDSENAFGVEFFRIDLPSLETIDSVTLPLHRAAKEVGGDYDGWEAEVVN